MRITYDSEVDALHIRCLETTVRAEHAAEGVAVDYDAEGIMMGIEILDEAVQFGSKDTFKTVIFEGLGLQAG